jgi:hypothetical protein
VHAEDTEGHAIEVESQGAYRLMDAVLGLPGDPPSFGFTMRSSMRVSSQLPPHKKDVLEPND